MSKQTRPFGWVYLMRNKSMPGIIKIGFTWDDPWERANQLSVSTAVPSPFVVVYAHKTRYPREVEADMHQGIHTRRISPNREFFSSTLESFGTRVANDDMENSFFITLLKIAAREYVSRLRIRQARERHKRVYLKGDSELENFDNEVIAQIANQEQEVAQ